MSDSKFQLERVQGAPVSNDEILADIQRAATLAGTRVISQRLYSEFGKFDPTTASRRFGTWNKAVVAAGLALFLAVARPSQAAPAAPASGLVALSVVIAAAVGASILVARWSTRSRAGLLLATGGGIAFGYMAAVTSLTWRVLTHGVLHALGSWEPYAVAVSGVAGILLTQSAFGSGVLRLSLPTLTVVQPLVAILIGLLLLGERIDSHGLDTLWEVLGLAVMAFGVFTLARPEFPE